MIDKLAFRRLTPAHLGWIDVPVEPRPGMDFAGLALSAKRGAGATFWQGHQSGNQLVRLEAAITQLENLPKSRKKGRRAGPDPAEESRLLARVLTLLLGLPLRPGSSVGDVIAALEPLCPRILWSKARLVEALVLPAGTHERSLMALRDGLMVEVHLRQDRLYAVRVTDLELMILNDEVADVDTAMKPAVTGENVALLASDPVPFALKWGFQIDPESVEWGRGMDFAAAAPVQEFQVDANGSEIDLPEGVAGPEVIDLDLQDFSHGRDAVDTGLVPVDHDRQISSLCGLLAHVPDADLLSECALRCNGPATSQNAWPDLPGLARAAGVLNVFYDTLLCGGGLETWFVVYLEDVPDALAALRMTGAVEMEQFLIGFATRAAEAEYDIESRESWQEYFDRDARPVDEEEALRLAPDIIPYFRAWALVCPEVTAPAEAAAQRQKTQPVTIARNGFINGLEGMLQRAARGILGKTARRLVQKASGIMERRND